MGTARHGEFKCKRRRALLGRRGTGRSRAEPPSTEDAAATAEATGEEPKDPTAPVGKATAATYR